VRYSRAPVKLPTTAETIIHFGLYRAFALLALANLVAPHAWAADIDISVMPAFLLEGVPPNLILTIDNSETMRLAYAPTELSDASDDESEGAELGLRRYASPDINKIYYDPTKTYVPPLNADGTSMAHADFDAANLYPYLAEVYGCPPNPLDLDTDYLVVRQDELKEDCGTWQSVVGVSRPPFAYYELFDPYAPSNSNCTLDTPQVDAPDECFTRVRVGTPKDIRAAKCEPPNVTGRYDEFLCSPRDNTPLQDRDESLSAAELARRNFANWFVYYRTRALIVKTVLTHIMQTLHPRVRLTYQSTFYAGGFAPGMAGFDILGSTRFAPYTSRQKGGFYDWLASMALGGTSNLIASHSRVGEFVKTDLAQADDIASYRANDDFAANSCGVDCRANFHLMLTDGEWEDEFHPGFDYPRYQDLPDVAPVLPCASGSDCWIEENQDGKSRPSFPEGPFNTDGARQVPEGNLTRRYEDDVQGMLADAAFYYWATDLRSEPNDVPPLIREPAPSGDPSAAELFWHPKNDPANWQHLTLFTVGFGVDGDVTPIEDATDGEYLDGADTRVRVSDEGFPCRVDDDADGQCNGFGYEGGATSADISDASKHDDLFHAALNARGGYFSASDPAALLSSLSDVLETVSSAALEQSSNASAAFNTGSLTAATRVYQALVDTTDWTGQLRAFRVSQGAEVADGECPEVARGELCDALDQPYWEASEELPEPDDRVIVTRAGNVPTKFRGTDEVIGKLSLAQQRGLVCSADEPELCGLGERLESGDDGWDLAKYQIEYLRGEANPSDDYGFRERAGLLGDIVNSNVVVLLPPSGAFVDDSYRTFRNEHEDRDDVVFVGANDGMLHAFAGDSGTELFAYVPEAIYGELGRLRDAAYGAGVAKKAFVDGGIQIADVKLASGWRTVLVGTLGLGAQGVYALDVTAPTTVDETDPGALALWELTDASGSDTSFDGNDMGFSFAPPAIVRIDPDLGDETGPAWVALVSNGYNNTYQDATHDILGHCTDGHEAATNCTVSTTGNAVLYVLNIDGSDAARIRAVLDTGEGVGDDPRLDLDDPPSPSNRTNGLARVTAVDNDGDLIADVAYGGDLFGNVWRFDLVALDEPDLVFSAVDDDGSPQPITTKIAVARHPTGVGVLLLFGTGQYLNAGDKSDASKAHVQSFYGIWDDGSAGSNGAPSVTRDELLQQRFTHTATVDGASGGLASSGRVSTDNRIQWSGDDASRGWYIDLVVDPDDADPDAEGERVVTPAQVRNGRVVFVSLIPGDCCDAGGTSWINVLDVADGSRLAMIPFDYNFDGVFNADDLLEITERGETVNREGSSIRIETDGGTGIYSPPSLLGLGSGQVQGVVTDSEGDLVKLLESSALNWRNWQQIR